jgi:hypothetical protein
LPSTTEMSPSGSPWSKCPTARVLHESHIYEGATHSFFDRSFAQWNDACDDAGRRMLEFDPTASLGAPG